MTGSWFARLVRILGLEKEDIYTNDTIKNQDEMIASATIFFLGGRSGHGLAF
jgi:hypothetical protein